MKVDSSTGVSYFDEAKVFPVAYSMVNPDGCESFFNEFDLSLTDNRDTLTHPSEIPELAGRLCYMSFGADAGRKQNSDYLQHIIKLKHFSVIEHVSMSVIIRGASRGFTHEVVRHRHLSISQFSTRYCDKICFVIPCLYRGDAALTNVYLDHCHRSLQLYTAAYDAVLKHLKETDRESTPLQRRKKARGAARSYLPIGTEAPIMLTGNLRTWREMFEKRMSPAAEMEIQLVMKQIKHQLGYLFGNVFLEGLDSE